MEGSDDNAPPPRMDLKILSSDASTASSTTYLIRSAPVPTTQPMPATTAETAISPQTTNSFDDRSQPARFWSSTFFSDLFRRSKSPSSSDEQEKERLKKEYLVLERKSEWLKMLPRWSQYLNSSKARLLCWYGIPPSIRGYAWSIIIGNNLKITKQLYKAMIQRADSISASSSHLSGDDQIQEYIKLVETDLPRTFPQLKFFHDQGPLALPLLNIVQSFIVMRPDIGYRQGMTFLAGMILLSIEEEDQAFIAFANLLNGDLHFALFHELESALPHLKAFDILLQSALPKLSKHFQGLEITSEMYLFDWILTIYSHSFPLDVAMRIWDSFLFYGRDSCLFLFKTAMGVLRLYERALLSSTFEQALHLLNHIPSNMNCDHLFDCISDIRLNERQLRQALSSTSE